MLFRSKGFITFDIKDKDIDLASRAFANITNPQGFAQAYEAIFPHRNGLPIVGLFNGDQALQDEAPSGQGGVVDDTTVPPPHTHRLQSSISCIRCHGKHDFWQPVQNDIPTLYAAELRTDPNDVGRFLDPQNATRLRLIGQYGGDGIPRHLERNRIDFRAKIRECVEVAPGNVWEGSDPKANPGWTDVGQKVTEFLGNEWNQYIYGTIDAEQALWEIGIEVTPKQGEQEPERKRRAVAVFNRLVPVGLLSGVSGLLTEDPRIKALRVGMAVSRQDWGLVRGYVSGSIRRTPTRKAA